VTDTEPPSPSPSARPRRRVDSLRSAGPAVDVDVTVDVMVVGAGPAGCATAIELAQAGFDVTIVEQRRLPRPKTCAGLVSPRALASLGALGIAVDELDHAHRINALDVAVDDRHRSITWPQHPDLVDHALVVPRHVLDMALVERARSLGVRVLEEHQAVAPIIERGLVAGARIRSSDDTPAGIAAPRSNERGAPGQSDLRGEAIRARYSVIADGANSRFGRALGTHRDRTWPMATAVHSSWASPRARQHSVEVSFNLYHDDGHRLTGFGWVVPDGNDTVDIGVGLVSTTSGFRSVNTTHLLDDFARSIASRWEIDPDAALRSPMSGRVPLGGSVRPISGPTSLVVGDAAAAANPISGFGIDTALVTGSIAGGVLIEALERDDPAALQRYWRLINDRTAALYKVGRLIDRFAGHPRVFDRIARSMVTTPWAAETAVRLGTDSMRDGRGGRPEQLYRLLRAISRLAPDA